MLQTPMASRLADGSMFWLRACILGRIRLPTTNETAWMPRKIETAGQSVGNCSRANRAGSDAAYGHPENRNE